MKVYRFNHENPVKAGCCNYSTTTTYWMANSREQAKQEISEHTSQEERENHGNCATCLAKLLAEGDYEVEPE